MEKIKHIKIVFLTGLILLSLFLLTTFSKTLSQSDWQTFSDRNIGLEFEHPIELKAFYPRAVNFRDCEECPGLIDVSVEKVSGPTTGDPNSGLSISQSIDEVFRNQPNLGKVIEKITINDVPAFVTVPGDENEKTVSDRRIYVIRNGLLYTISARSIDIARFWKSIKFIDP